MELYSFSVSNTYSDGKRAIEYEIKNMLRYQNCTQSITTSSDNLKSKMNIISA
jgi:regulatory protein YycH of two-component signal transduction system YycFG